jgi:hypothetical protein
VDEIYNLRKNIPVKLKNGMSAKQSLCYAKEMAWKLFGTVQI